jgi:hypothetical protein
MRKHQRAAELFPRSFRSHANYGTCRLWLGDGRTALASLALAAGDTARGAAEAAAALTEFDAAARAYQTALRIKRGFPEATTNLRLCLQRILALPPLTESIRQYQAQLPGSSRVDNGRK